MQGDSLRSRSCRPNNSAVEPNLGFIIGERYYMHIQRFTYRRLADLADSTRIAELSTSLAYRHGAAVVQSAFHEMLACDNMLGITKVLALGHHAQGVSFVIPPL